MIIIKRYPNRKLYDTASKQYITLEGIADLIRQGYEVQVIDNASGEDLTTITLTQVILELEKKKSGFLPHTVLTGLIRASESRLNSLQRGLRSPITFLHQFDEEIRRRIQALVKQGDLAEQDGSNLLEKLLSIGKTIQRDAASREEELEGQVGQILVEHDVPTRDDLENISRQLEILAAKLEELGGEETN